MISKVLIVTSEAFPYGMAGTNRVISLAKGFISNTTSAEVVTYFKYDDKDSNRVNPASGIFEDIEYRNIFATSKKHSCRFIRLIHEYCKPIKVFLYSYGRIRSDTLVLYYGDKTWPAVFLKIAARMRKTLLIKEETEHPKVRSRQRRGISRYVYSMIHYRIFDAVLVITDQLYNFFRSGLKYTKPILVVPMIVDVDRFANESPFYSSSIVFSGELNDKKEGLSSLIRAYSLVASKYPSLKLELYGSANNSDQIELIKRLITDLNLEDKVLLHGYRTRDEMTGILMEAKLFVFSRPPSLQATYGFSTKLGEYLATGRPVVVTEVGEINMFLNDRENAYICLPEASSIAAKIVEILDNYDNAKKVGEKGRETAFRYFNNKIETKKILEYFDPLFQ